MSDKTATATVSLVSAHALPKKQTAKAKKPRIKPSHPPNSEMVLAAVKALKERNGSSLQAIKKYISATYEVKTDKQSPFIKKYLKNAVDQGVLIQTKGKGASGSFKIPTAKSDGKPKSKAIKSKPAVKKATIAKKSKILSSVKKSPAAKKVASVKKVAKKPAVKKIGAKLAAKKSMAKKTTKSPAKPKAPKPKKTNTSRATKTAVKK